MKKIAESVYNAAPIKSIREMMELAVQEAGNSIAFRFREKGRVRRKTYREFQDDNIALGTALAEKGILGEHIAVVGKNSYPWINVYLTVLQGDGVIVPLDKGLPEEDLLNLLNESDSAVLFYSGRFEELLQKNRCRIPGVKYFIGFDRKEDDGCFLSFNRLLKFGKRLAADGAGEYLTREGKDKNALKQLTYTSDGSGEFRGVMLSEHNLTSCVSNGLGAFTVCSAGLSVLPLHNIYELSGLLISLHKHAVVCINENLKMMQRNLLFYKPDYICLAPGIAEAFYKKIWMQAEKNGREKALKRMIHISSGLRNRGIDMRKQLFGSVRRIFGGNMKKIICTGAPLRAEIGEFFDAIGISVVNSYGIAECSSFVCVNQDGKNDPAAAGVPLSCCQLRFEDITEEGRGEICVKGDVVMLGYYKNPELTAEVIDREGWFHTGDFGYINAAGQLVVTGCRKNLIVLENGKNVFPEEIESHLLSIPYIKESVVYGLTNEKGKEVGLCAEVFLDMRRLQKEGAAGINESAARLRNDIFQVSKVLPDYEHISRIVVRDQEFEKTAMNKIKRVYANSYC